MAKMSENSRKVFDYMVSIGDKNVTANDIAEALALSPRSVNGIITQAFQKKGFMERIPAEMENPDGTHRSIKLIKLTEAGRSLDPDAEE